MGGGHEEHDWPCGVLKKAAQGTFLPPLHEAQGRACRRQTRKATIGGQVGPFMPIQRPLKGILERFGLKMSPPKSHKSSGSLEGAAAEPPSTLMDT